VELQVEIRISRIVRRIHARRDAATRPAGVHRTGHGSATGGQSESGILPVAGARTERIQREIRDRDRQLRGHQLQQPECYYIDPHLRNPYTLTWSSGFQWQFQPNTLAEAVYQGSAGVGLVPAAGIAASGSVPTVNNAVNMNVLPQSIYSSTDMSLLNTVYSATQNYLLYPQFGTITYNTSATTRTVPIMP
jgi:hypothetical protein